jgi:putative DNA primase/helicase
MWLHWTGHRWQWDEEEEHRELVRELARALPDTDTWRRFKSSALSAAGVSGVARLAQSDRSIAVAYDKLDANPWILNTPAGIVDLKTGDLRAPDPTALCTRTTLCAPDQTADTARWNEFLTYTFDNDTELIGYLQRLVGYSVIGSSAPTSCRSLSGPAATARACSSKPSPAYSATTPPPHRTAS